jgi:hypothetical protein
MGFIVFPHDKTRQGHCPLLPPFGRLVRDAHAPVVDPTCPSIVFFLHNGALPFFLSLPSPYSLVFNMPIRRTILSSYFFPTLLVPTSPVSPTLSIAQYPSATLVLPLALFSSFPRALFLHTFLSLCSYSPSYPSYKFIPSFPPFPSFLSLHKPSFKQNPNKKKKRPKILENQQSFPSLSSSTTLPLQIRNTKLKKAKTKEHPIPSNVVHPPRSRYP